eukprot:3253608-Amphidinium_carterae.1
MTAECQHLIHRAVSLEPMNPAYMKNLAVLSSGVDEQVAMRVTPKNTTDFLASECGGSHLSTSAARSQLSQVSAKRVPPAACSDHSPQLQLMVRLQGRARSCLACVKKGHEKYQGGQVCRCNMQYIPQSTKLDQTKLCPMYWHQVGQSTKRPRVGPRLANPHNTDITGICPCYACQGGCLRGKFPLMQPVSLILPSTSNLSTGQVGIPVPSGQDNNKNMARYKLGFRNSRQTEQT